MFRRCVCELRRSRAQGDAVGGEGGRGQVLRETLLVGREDEGTWVRDVGFLVVRDKKERNWGGGRNGRPNIVGT